MSKSRDAFRTISEVAEWLDTPAHVLRFWESKFTQVKPVKRAGGRRYYRPADMELLGGIKTLLHEEGMTIKGVQKVLREQGVKHVAALASEPVDSDEAEDMSSEIAEAPFADVPEPDDIVVPFAPRETAGARKSARAAATESAADPDVESAPQLNFDEEPEVSTASTPELAGTDTESETVADASSETDPEPDAESASTGMDLPVSDPEPDATHEIAAAPIAEDTTPVEEFSPGDRVEEPEESHQTESFEGDDSDSPLPDFLQSPLSPEAGSDAESETDEADDLPTDFEPETTEPEPAAAPEDDVEAEPIATALPANPDLRTIDAAPGCLGHLSRIPRLSPAQRQAIAPLAAQLQARMAGSRNA